MLNSFRCLFIGAMAQISSASERKSCYAARCNQIKKNISSHHEFISGSCLTLLTLLKILQPRIIASRQVQADIVEMVLQRSLCVKTEKAGTAQKLF